MSLYHFKDVLPELDHSHLEWLFRCGGCGKDFFITAKWQEKHELCYECIKKHPDWPHMAKSLYGRLVAHRRGGGWHSG